MYYRQIESKGESITMADHDQLVLDTKKDLITEGYEITKSYLQHNMRLNNNINYIATIINFTDEHDDGKDFSTLHAR